MAQPCPQIIEHLIRDVNPKLFHNNNPLVALAVGQLNAQQCRTGSHRSLSTDRYGALRPASIPVRRSLDHAALFTDVISSSVGGLVSKTAESGHHKQPFGRLMILDG